MPEIELQLYENGDLIGKYMVHTTDEPLTVDQIIAEIQNAEMRKAHREYHMREWSNARKWRAPITLEEYARYCFAPHLMPAPPPPPNILAQPLPFSTYVDEYSV
jgi:hypothetical protein